MTTKPRHNAAPDGRGQKRVLFEEDRLNRLTEALRAGNFVEVAATYAGIHPATVYQYLKEAESPDCDPQVADVARRITEARASAEIRNVALIQTAARNPRHWQAAAWFLERAHQTRWGRRQGVELTGANGGPIEVDTDPRAALLSMLEAFPEEAPGEPEPA